MPYKTTDTEVSKMEMKILRFRGMPSSAALAKAVRNISPPWANSLRMIFKYLRNSAVVKPQKAPRVIKNHTNGVTPVCVCVCVWTTNKQTNKKERKKERKREKRER